MKTDKKIVTVVAAVICDDMKSPKKIFATQRGYGEFKGGWEFPGGKIEQGETSQEALDREIIEELATKIKVGELIDTVEYNYPESDITSSSWIYYIAEKLGITKMFLKFDDLDEEYVKGIVEDIIVNVVLNP